MTVWVFVRHFLSDYSRNRVNLLLLVVVPVIFVGVVAGTLSDAAELLGGPGGPAVETAAAAWAAAFLAGIGMYFQTAATRDTDQRIVIAGLRPTRLVEARLLTGAGLACLGSAAALLTLLARTGIHSPTRVVGGTLMAAVIYVAIGAAVGAVVHNPVNGTVVILLVWILDVFLGPAMGAADRPGTRVLPMHFVTLWMIDLASGHSGRPGDAGLALVWTISAAGAACALMIARARPAHARPARLRPDSALAQILASVMAAWRDARRNPALWGLYLIIPVIFILLADAITPERPIFITVREQGRRLSEAYLMPDVHGATMAPIAVASLAALAGLFTLLDSRDGDGRAALAGMRTGALLTARLGVLAAAALLATAVSLAATATVFDAVQWTVYAGANLLIALTYGLVGALLAPLFGRVGGVFIAFLLPFLDIGVNQSPMLHPQPAAWARALPGYGGSRVLIDGALTRGFDETGSLLLALGWLAGLALLVAAIYRRSVAPSRTR
ncbi:ABC transporter permease [Micromonospora chalcea]|uniref:ABC transporter permease n=1 Tax=Micromonospora chalcea TaxID=1874 RepID=UPI0021A8B79E|nr:ABC transporter permease [Micromonospora chalcea]MCT2281206.1 ABC transporter permease [Micromonospora chalcea]